MCILPKLGGGEKKVGQILESLHSPLPTPHSPPVWPQVELLHLTSLAPNSRLLIFQLQPFLWLLQHLIFVFTVPQRRDLVLWGCFSLDQLPTSCHLLSRRELWGPLQGS